MWPLDVPHCSYLDLDYPIKFTAAAAVLASCVPSLASALVGNYWWFDDSPSDGLNDITFPFNIANAPHKRGFYFAQQFDFDNVKNGSYTGLQPRPDSNGKSVIRAVFSSFEGGTTTVHPNCHYGADNGTGASCAVEINGDYSHTYNLVTENIGGTAWRGTLVDTVTGTSTVIGEWTLPQGSGKILVDGQSGFVEYFIWNGQPSHTCKSLPFTEATFYNPTSKTPGASGGEVAMVHEYGDCIGRAGYSLTEVPGGYDIKVGF